MTTLHIHLDESGNFVFTKRGTRFYIFTAVWTYNPAPLSAELTVLRYRLIKEGYFRDAVLDDLGGFHACDDPPPRRKAVMEAVSRHSDWNFASIVVEKNKVNPSLYDPETFYPKFLTMVINFVLRGRVRPWTSQVLIYTDTLPMTSRRKSESVNLTIKRSCVAELNGKPFRIMHHPSESNPWIQIADYCSWAICKKWEFDEPEAYDRLYARLAAREINPMSRGDRTEYY